MVKSPFEACRNLLLLIPHYVSAYLTLAISWFKHFWALSISTSHIFLLFIISSLQYPHSYSRLGLRDFSFFNVPATTFSTQLIIMKRDISLDCCLHFIIHCGVLATTF